MGHRRGGRSRPAPAQHAPWSAQITRARSGSHRRARRRGPAWSPPGRDAGAAAPAEGPDPTSPAAGPGLSRRAPACRGSARAPARHHVGRESAARRRLRKDRHGGGRRPRCARPCGRLAAAAAPPRCRPAGRRHAVGGAAARPARRSLGGRAIGTGAGSGGGSTRWPSLSRDRGRRPKVAPPSRIKAVRHARRCRRGRALGARAVARPGRPRSSRKATTRARGPSLTRVNPVAICHDTVSALSRKLRRPAPLPPARPV